MKKLTISFLKNNLGMNEDDAKLVMEAQRKFPSILAEEGQGFCLDGRLLHSELGVSKAFATWIKINLGSVDAKENKDYTVSLQGIAQFNQKEIENMSPQKRSSYRITEEYHLTLDIAKEICMITGLSSQTGDKLRENSKLVRMYFIKLEKAIKDGIEWEKLRFPQKQGYKEMCKIIDTNYVENHPGIEKTPNHAYSNEANMINKALLGYSAKKLKDILEVEQKDITRDNLQLECNKALLELQILNGSLILNNIDYKARKVMIENTCKSRFEDLKNRFNKVFAKDMVT